MERGERVFRVKVEQLADGSNLSDVIMRRAEVTGVRAARLDLRRADLRRTRISDCAFTDALMAELRLSGARISQTLFRGCDLTAADLSRVWFTDVEFEECTIDGTSFHGATYDGTLVLPGVDVPLRAG